MSVEIIGPFEHHAVCINGWQVPYLTATPMNGGRIEIALDGRYAIELTVRDAEHVLPFIANAIAIAHGYTCHPSDDSEPIVPTQRHPFNRMHAI